MIASMRPSSRYGIALLLAGLLLGLRVLLPAPAHADDPVESVFVEQTTFDQRLNEQLPLDLRFRDDAGQSVRLADYFADRPVILLLGYYRCPSLCPIVRDELVKSIAAIEPSAGEEYELLLVSIDPHEGPEAAALKKKQYVRWYDRPSGERGMHFLTGDADAIEALSQAVGYRYGYDTDSTEYAHATGITILTPGGRISKYMFGIQFEEKVLELALDDAAESEIGSPVQQLLLLCFHYDPETGKYTLAIMKVLRLAGVLTMLSLGGFVALTLYRDRREPQLPA